jgi:uncharacterized protein YndB with AHSA1/START domain
MHETAEKPAQNKAAAPPTLMSRVFDAPRALVFEMWTNVEHFKKWFAPKPLTTPKAELDPRAGGVFNFTMRMPNGVEFPFVGKFEEVIQNEKLVFTGLVHDDNIAHTTVTFEDAPGGKTKISVRQTYAYASPATGGAVQGWTSTLDNLAETVANLKQR